MKSNYCDRNAYPLLHEEHEEYFHDSPKFERNLAIYESVITGEARPRELAEEFSISQQLVYSIVQRVAKKIRNQGRAPYRRANGRI